MGAYSDKMTSKHIVYIWK